MPRDSVFVVRDSLVHSHSGPLDRRRLLRGLGGSALAAAMLAGGGPAFVAGRSSVLAAAREADASPRDGLEALLALVPASVAATAVAGGTLFYHADLKAQFDALGVDRTDPDWITRVKLVATTISLALSSRLFQVGLVDVVQESLGFVPLEIDRTLETGTPPETLSIFQGGFDRERMESAWEKAGYKQVSLDDDQTLWTKGEEGELDLKDPLGAAGAGSFNNLLMLDDETLLMSRMGAVVRDAARHAAKGSGGAGSSMLAMPYVQPAVRALLPTTVSSLMVSGAMLVPRMIPDFSQPGTPVVATSGGDGPEMPAAAMAAFGVDAGFLGQSKDEAESTPILPGDTPVDDVIRAQVRLAMRSEDDAAAAVEIVPERWETLDSIVNGEPYADLMVLLDAEVSAEEPTVAAFDFDQGVAGNRWIQLVNVLDLLPFAPGTL